MTPALGGARLLDRLGRISTDLRVSLTHRCNLRCAYRMPADGLEWLPTADTLTDGEVVRLVGIAVGQLGVTEVRLTGGEPTLRASLPKLVGRPGPGERLPRHDLAGPVPCDHRS